MMPFETKPSGYVLQPLREGADFTLYRGRQRGNPSPVLVVAPAAEHPPPQILWQWRLPIIPNSGESSKLLPKLESLPPDCPWTGAL